MSTFSPYGGTPQGVTKQVGKTLDSALEFLELARRWSRDVSTFLKLVSDIPLLQGELHTGLTTAASATNQEFPHALGRTYRGVIILGGDQGTVTLRPMLPSTSSDPTRFYVVRPSAATATNFSVWVF